CGVEMAIVRGGDADDVHAGGEQLLDGIGARTVRERCDTPGRRLPIALGARARSRGDGGERDVDRSEVAAIEPVAMQTLEERAIGLVEDHAEADHAGAKTAGCGCQIHGMGSAATFSSTLYQTAEVHRLQTVGFLPEFRSHRKFEL